MFAFAIVLLVFQSIGLLWGFIAPMVSDEKESSDIVIDWIFNLIQKTPAIVFTILFICGVR